MGQRVTPSSDCGDRPSRGVGPGAPCFRMRPGGGGAGAGGGGAGGAGRGGAGGAGGRRL